MWISTKRSPAVTLFPLILCANSVTLIPIRVASSAPANAKETSRSSNEVNLSNDPRLRKQSSEEQVGGPLKDYLVGLSDLTDVTLKAKTPLENSGFTVLNVDIEVNRLMKGIASIYHLSWTIDQSSGSSYTLQETEVDRKRRLKARSDAVRNAAIKANARWDNVRKLASKSDRELQTLASRGDAMAQCLLHPRGRAMAQLVFGLPPMLIRAMWDKGSVQIPLSQLSGNLQRLAVSTQSGGTLRVTDMDTGLPVDVGNPDPDSLRLEIGGTVDRPTVLATVSHGYTGIRANILYAEGMVRQPPAERRENLIPRKTNFSTGHPLLHKVTLRDPASRIGLERGERPPKAVPLAKLLKDLAEQGVPPIISACDYKPKNKEWLAKQWWLGSDIVNQPLHQALDLICADFEYEWEYRDGMLLLWPSRWYVAE